MSEKKLVPKRRFKKYNDEWGKGELGNLSDVTKLAGFEYTKHVIYSDTGTIVALRGLNVKNGKIILNDVKYIDQSDFSKLNRSKLFKDDVLFTYVGTVGELAIIPDNNKYYLAPNVSRIRLNREMDSQFVMQMMGDERFYDKVIFPLIATSSQPALSMENIRKFAMHLPVFEEQQKIGNFFKNLDQMITLEQRKLEKTKALKSAYLAEMFPTEGERVPKRRFAGFTGEWKQRRFEEEIELYSGLTYSPIDVNKSGTFVLRSSNVQNGKIVEADNVYVNSGIVNSDNVRVGDVIVVVRNGSRSLIGKHAQIKRVMEKTVIGAFMTGIRSGQSNFINALLDTQDFKREVDKNLGATINQITNGMFRDMNFLFPADDEQEKIGEFVKQLDDIISNNEVKLGKLKATKQAYLQEMFV